MCIYEFKKKIKSLGLKLSWKLDAQGEYFNIYNSSDIQVATVYIDKMYSVSTQYPGFKYINKVTQKKFLDVVFEFISTPVFSRIVIPESF